MLHSFLENAARTFPDKVALICGKLSHTYRELDALANQHANGLIASGIERGDRVGVYLPNSIEAVVAIFGILKAGAVFVPINHSTKPDKLAYILEDCGARALATPLDPSQPNTAPPKRCIDIDLAAIIYTSGSSGKPKGVMLTHRNMIAAATSINEYLGNTSADIVLNVLPLSFDYGLYQVLLMFQVGGTVVLERAFVYPSSVLDTLVRHRVTGFPLVPTISAILLQMNLSQWDFSSLRYITNTAAALPVGQIARLRHQFPSVQIFSMYGLTECKRVSCLPPDQIDRRPESVGLAIPNTEAYVINGEGERAGPEETGELVVRGAHVMKGYWGLPEESARTLKPGPLPNESVLHTGDLFRTDEEGYLYFVGRLDDIIKSRGEKVSPREIEDVLSAMPEIVEAAVLGIPDAILGEAICAFVVLREGTAITNRDILQHCSIRLEEYLVPQRIEFRDSLPKTPNGKIDKRLLAAS